MAQADPYSFTEFSENPPENAPVRAVLGSVAGIRQAQLGLAERRLIQQEANDDISNTVKIHREALNQAAGYYDLAASLTKMNTETERKLDAADFLSAAQNVAHTDPDYENKISELHAKYPLAGGDDAVKEVLAVKHAARGNFNETLQKGGAFEFEEDSPAFHKFQEIFHRTGDMNAARAAAGHIDKGEQMVRQARAAGLITDEDIFEDPKQGIVHPHLHDEFGYLNYNALLNAAAKRQGETVGKPVKAEEAQYLHDRDFVSKNSTKVDDLDGATKQLYINAAQRAVDYERRHQGAEPPPSTAKSYLDF